MPAIPANEKVLLVEDDDAVRDLLVGVLRKAGWEVIGAASGLEALARLAELRFAAILCDLDLGRGPNGIEVLKQRPLLNAATPFVMLTAHGTVDRCLDAMRHHATDFIEKPSSPARIVQAVRQAISGTDSDASTPDLGIDGPNPGLRPEDEHVATALRQIEARYSDPTLSVATIARNVNVSPDYLGRLFQGHLGRSVIEVLNRQRVETAARLLDDSHLSVYEVALECGYRATKGLDKWFKELKGVTPTEWRLTRKTRKIE